MPESALFCNGQMFPPQILSITCPRPKTTGELNYLSTKIPLHFFQMRFFSFFLSCFCTLAFLLFFCILLFCLFLLLFLLPNNSQQPIHFLSFFYFPPFFPQ